MLQGQSIIAGESRTGAGAEFSGVNPATGDRLAPAFKSATLKNAAEAPSLAAEAFFSYSKVPAKLRAQFLRHIAIGLEGSSEELVNRAHLETGLPLTRLRGELARTANQLRMFAEIIEEGSWVNARIDLALPQRSPLPRPDICSMLRPIGPVVVFGASNFPLAFSVAGGDTASALAAGNPVLVKAHPAHPGTSELAAQLICGSVREFNLHPGVFALLFDAGIEIGSALVQHPAVKAVGFTGSLAAGRALMNLVSSRPDPIPCFAEMSSSNPLFILPEALQSRASAIASGLFDSFTLGVGQFCTKPGLIFLPEDQSSTQLIEELKRRTSSSSSAVMLTESICRRFRSNSEKRTMEGAIEVLAETALSSGETGFRAAPILMQCSGKNLLENPNLAAELFGPSALIVRYTARTQLLALARSLDGHLTASLHGTEADLSAAADLVDILQQKVGRLIFNGFPTGVEVSHAMVHGGPYPATSDSRWTSVGSQAIFRFARPICYQDFPQSALPEELRNENPLGIWRLINGAFTRDAVRC